MKRVWYQHSTRLQEQQQQQQPHHQVSCIHKIKYVLDASLFFWMKIIVYFVSWTLCTITHTHAYTCTHDLDVYERAILSSWQSICRRRSNAFWIEPVYGALLLLFQQRKVGQFSYASIARTVCALATIEHSHIHIIFTIIPGSCQLLLDTICFYFAVVSSWAVCWWWRRRWR